MVNETNNTELDMDTKGILTDEEILAELNKLVAEDEEGEWDGATIEDLLADEADEADEAEEEEDDDSDELDPEIMELIKSLGDEY